MFLWNIHFFVFVDKCLLRYYLVAVKTVFCGICIFLYLSTNIFVFVSLSPIVWRMWLGMSLLHQKEDILAFVPCFKLDNYSGAHSGAGEDGRN